MFQALYNKVTISDSHPKTFSNPNFNFSNIVQLFCCQASPEEDKEQGHYDANAPTRAKYPEHIW